MNLQIIILRGLPGSGKSTYAKELLLKMNDPANNSLAAVRINKDMLRQMLQLGEFFGSDEAVNAAMYAMTRTYLERGVSVISDNMNLNPKHLEVFGEIASQVNAKHVGVYVNVNVIDIETSTEECIARDFGRLFKDPTGHIGEKTIRFLDESFRKHETPNGFPALPGFVLNWTRMS